MLSPKSMGAIMADKVVKMVDHLGMLQACSRQAHIFLGPKMKDFR